MWAAPIPTACAGSLSRLWKRATTTRCAANLRAEVRGHSIGGAHPERLQPVAWIMPFAVFAGATVLTVWLVHMWKSRALAQPVARPNLNAAELEALRKKARQETEF